MTEQLTEKQKRHFQKVFSLFNNDRNRIKDKSEHTNNLKSLEQYQIELKHQARVEGDSADNEKSSSTQETLSPKMKDQNTEEELIEVFKEFNNEGKGSISTADLGDRLTEGELDEMV